jgi:hypothetical protein
VSCLICAGQNQQLLLKANQPQLDHTVLAGTVTVDKVADASMTVFIALSGYHRDCWPEWCPEAVQQAEVLPR